MKYLVPLVTVALLVVTPDFAFAEAQDDLTEAWALKRDGRFDEAAAAFERARAAGASSQLIELELGYLSTLRGDANAARAHFTAAKNGNDRGLARRAEAEADALAQPEGPPAATTTTTTATPPSSPLDDGYRAKAKGALAEARSAFERARANPAQAQVASMELGYLAASAGDPDTARLRFDEAAGGRDADLGAQARRERGSLPRHFFGDAYFDAYGWDRRAGVTSSDALMVPTLKMRAFFRPVLSVPVDVYGSVQVTRDTASRGFVGLALPKVYADNYATFGAGLRAKLWRRLELFAQVGPAINLLNDGRDRTALDIRGGALFYSETRDCGPLPEHGVRARFLPCAEAYAEGVFASRFHDDFMGYARPRAAAGYLVTGPVLWQVVAEGRVAKDINNDYWNNFADAGVGPRWRLLAPFRFDLLFTANAGAYFGLANRDPAPSQLTYGDLRVLASTYLEL